MQLTPSQLYTLLFHHFHHQNWWPVDATYHQQHNTDPRSEIIIGAILTQNTAWSNVEKALSNLKKHNALDLSTLDALDIQTVKTLIQPSGFFNQKADRLKKFTDYLQENYNSNLTTFFSQPLEDIRVELLSLQGIGYETADSILLYAGEYPIFVVDAYTKRLCMRIPFETKTDYQSIQDFFQQDIMQHIPQDQLVAYYKEYHALIVVVAKHYCKKKPICTQCPIQKFCRKLLE
jgi:endonuclease-3 related protein